MGLAGRKPIIGVIGSSSAGEPVLESAWALGRILGMRGWNLVCGGGGGIMGAACRGFKETAKDGQTAIGIIPGDDPSWANEFVDVVIPSGMGWARNAVIARTASAIVAISGCSGTLSEIAFAWQMGKPIADLSSTGGWSARLAGKPVDDRRSDTVFDAKTPEKAVDFIAKALEGS